MSAADAGGAAVRDREWWGAEISEYLQQQRGLDPALVTNDALLEDDLGLDSLALTELGFMLFTRHDVTLDDGTILTVRTISDVLDMLTTKETGHTPAE